MKFGVTLGVLRSDMWIDAAVTADPSGVQPAALLSVVAARAGRIRLGTPASLLGVRPPFSTARVSAPS
jgi:alkanesulfonate monooxygenase SsuD/methylene tetrahydromethanopterin reductase-like flavin-dependent oxidoreductase (luciferase family)